jgi:RND family efflux transporter MFP subunit
MRLLVFAVAVPLILLSSCGGSPSGEPQRSAAASSAAPVAVTAAPVSRQEWPTMYEATGTVRARTTAVIASKVMGYVQQVSAQVGDRVAEGQVLVTLEVRDLDAAVRSAETARAEVHSAIPEADSAVAAAKASLDLAQTTFRRMQDLAARKSISDQEFDEASARLKAAQAGYDMARGRRAQLDSKMAEAEQGVRSATVMQEYARIGAPFAGIVTARSVEPGSLATSGAPLITIERDGVYRLEAPVDESRLAAVLLGQSVEVSIEAMDRRLNCHVSEIVPAMDAASRSALVKIDLPAVPQLRSGMFGRAFFPLGARTVVAVPAAAVIERGQLQSVFVVEDGAARTRLLTTGQRTGDFLEVLSGLSAGERVVAPVPTGLQDGARLGVRQ